MTRHVHSVREFALQSTFEGAARARAKRVLENTCARRGHGVLRRRPGGFLSSTGLQGRAGLE
eukprot:2593449-Lingulodinium_polyedra.AAC.1